MTLPTPIQRETGAVLMAQHQRWVEARRKLNGPEPAPRPKRPRPVSPFIRAVIEEREDRLRRDREFFERQIIDAPRSSPHWFDIVVQVAKKHKVGIRDIIGPGRTRAVVAARHECFWRMRHEINVRGSRPSLPMIGRWLGGMDHTTVIHGIRMHEQRMREAGGEA